MRTNGWTECRVAEIAAPTKNALVGGPFGSNLVQRDYEPSGVPVIRGQNMGFGRWVTGEFAFVSEQKAQKLSPNMARPGDLIFTQRGTLGQVAIVPDKPFDRYIISQSQMKLSADGSKADPLFLYYLFTTPQHQDYILRNAIQTGVPHTNLQHLRETPLRLPSLAEQRGIASVLGALDDKIELNRRMNETLEALAQSLFKSWFVDATRTGLPEGWRESTIGEEVRVVGGSTPRTSKPEFWEGGTHYWATPKDLASLTSPVLLDTARRITDAGVKEISSGVLPAGTVLLSSRAPIGYLAIGEVPVAVNQGFIAMVCDKELPNHFVRLWAKQNMDVIEANANGTTFLEISKKNFRPLPVVVPQKSVMDDFKRQVQPLHQRMVLNLQESRTLAELRDALLPKLLSGEIRVTIEGKNSKWTHS
jgi:type I restriction enzyme, S subunit